jgi:hypothetical protein
MEVWVLFVGKGRGNFIFTSRIVLAELPHQVTVYMEKESQLMWQTHTIVTYSI